MTFFIVVVMREEGVSSLTKGKLIGTGFACGVTTSSYMERRRPELDLACSEGTGEPLCEVFNWLFVFE